MVFIDGGMSVCPRPHPHVGLDMPWEEQHTILFLAAGFDNASLCFKTVVQCTPMLYAP